MITFINAKAFINGQIKENSTITVDNDKIIEINGTPKGEILDLNGKILCAGFIDIHTHGGLGKDCMEATYEALDAISKYHLSTGITTYCPTTMTASLPDINKALDNLRNFKSNYARTYGAHLEGPYLAPKAAGAHPLNLLLSPDEKNSDFIWKNLDVVSRITLAPDLNNAAWLTKKCTENGVQVSLGHDTSIDDEIEACISNGASSVTHTYNCTSRPSRRNNPKKHLGLTELALIEDSLICEVIADDRHVPNKLFKMIYSLKGSKGICLVSDSLSVAGMPLGDYYIGAGESKQTIRVEDGVAVLPSENTYAGSVTPISKMVVNLHALGINAEECLSMATLTPARLLKMTDRGDIQVGMLADFNILNSDLSVDKTILGGKLVNI